MKTTEPEVSGAKSAAESEPLIQPQSTIDPEPTERSQDETNSEETSALSAKFYYWVLSRL